jgi:hypothetical protein
VDHLDRTRERHQRVVRASHRFARGQDELGPDALAAGEQAVADGAMDGGRPIRLGGQGGVERGLDPPPPRLQPLAATTVGGWLLRGEVCLQRLTRCRR